LNKRKATALQWVWILPESVSGSAGLNPGAGGAAVSADDIGSRFITLRNPGTGQAGRYLIGGTPLQVYEVTRFPDRVPRSWFVGNTVQEDGALHLATPMDPVLLVLPRLQDAAKDAKFMILDQILVDKDYAAYTHLEEVDGLKQGLQQVCEVRGEGEYCGYKLSNEKLIEYLRRKVDRITLTLQGKQVSMGGGSSSALFTRATSQDAKATTGPNRILYAIGLLSEYIDEKTSEQLQKTYGLDGAAVAASAGAAAAAVKAPPKSDYTAPAGGSKPTRDYSSGASKAKAAPKSMSASAKALAKVNKKGMSSMMSFFGKAKKKQKT